MSYFHTVGIRSCPAKVCCIASFCSLDLSLAIIMGPKAGAKAGIAARVAKHVGLPPPAKASASADISAGSIKRQLDHVLSSAGSTVSPISAVIPKPRGQGQSAKRQRELKQACSGVDDQLPLATVPASLRADDPLLGLLDGDSTSAVCSAGGF